ncbi:transposase [Streptomyces violascens]|uniref:transposase n=1 Tax=Streptomyces violascens TaxID=67381 RepID=UPI0036A4A5FE
MPSWPEGAVRIVIETGRPIPEVAEEFGIHSGTLHSWVSWWRRNGSTSSDRPDAPWSWQRASTVIPVGTLPVNSGRTGSS